MNLKSVLDEKKSTELSVDVLKKRCADTRSIEKKAKGSRIRFSTPARV